MLKNISTPTNFEGFKLEPAYLHSETAEQCGKLVLKLLAKGVGFFPPSYSELIMKAWLHHPTERSLQTLHMNNPDQVDENRDIVEALSVFEEVIATNMGKRAVSSFFVVYKERGVLQPHFDPETTVAFNLTGTGTLNLYDQDEIVERITLNPGDKYTITPDIKHSARATGHEERVIMVLNSPHPID